jgi:rubredoxin
MRGTIEKYWIVECPSCENKQVSFDRIFLIHKLKDNKWKKYKDKWYCQCCIEQNKHKN